LLNLINPSLLLIPKMGVDKAFLSRIQRGFGASGFTWGMEEVAYLIGIIVVATLIFYLIKTLFRLDKYTLANLNMDRIENPRRIRRIVLRSIDLRAIYDIEVYDQAYQEIYKCMPIAINNDNELEVEISSYLDPNLDFKDKNVRVAFRMSRRGKQEFYGFETTSLYLDYTVVRGLREKSIRLLIPSVVNRGQKRGFVRIEPVGAFSMNINIIRPTKDGPEVPLKSFKLVAEATVNDISIGGLNAKIIKNNKKQDFRKNDLIYLHFKLPINDLPLENIPTNFFIKARIIDFEQISSTDNLLKLFFVERGRLNRQTRSIAFRKATWMSFDDLSFWIQAYQRHQLQEERGIKPRPDNVRNIYSAEPLNVMPKYPRIPIKRGPDTPTKEEA